jgi:hypothetical protein
MGTAATAKKYDRMMGLLAVLLALGATSVSGFVPSKGVPWVARSSPKECRQADTR